MQAEPVTFTPSWRRRASSAIQRRHLTAFSGSVSPRRGRGPERSPGRPVAPTAPCKTGLGIGGRSRKLRLVGRRGEGLELQPSRPSVTAYSHDERPFQDGERPFPLAGTLTYRRAPTASIFFVQRRPERKDWREKSRFRRLSTWSATSDALPDQKLRDRPRNMSSTPRAASWLSPRVAVARSRSTSGTYAAREIYTSRSVRRKNPNQSD